MDAMKKLAVVAVATSITHTELVQLKQESSESFQSFGSQRPCKTNICQYTTKRTCTLPQTVDFTDIIIRDVLLAGIADMDICRDVLGTMKDILDKRSHISGGE